MPVYEFYCCDCHTVFSFLSRKMQPGCRPACPRCARPGLERQVSRFAVSSSRQEGTEQTDLPAGLDEQRLEQAMLGLADEMATMDENDPRSMARFMRKLADQSSIHLPDGVQEALCRMEKGEDPEQIEQDLGGMLTDDASGLNQLFRQEGFRGLKRRYTVPDHDETLYRLPDDNDV